MEESTLFSWFPWIIALGSIAYMVNTSSKQKKLLHDKDAEIAKLKELLKKEDVKGQPQKPTLPPVSNPDKKTPGSAKDAFINNLTLFVPHLNSLLGNAYKEETWTDIIIGINNDELTSLWKRVHSRPEAMLRLLASWGICPDRCMEFVASKAECDNYDLADGGYIIQGEHYVVVSNSWIYTTTENNQTIKKIILKGEAKKK
mgnify:CR=1 FL=1